MVAGREEVEKPLLKMKIDVCLTYLWAMGSGSCGGREDCEGPAGLNRQTLKASKPVPMHDW